MERLRWMSRKNTQRPIDVVKTSVWDVVGTTSLRRCEDVSFNTRRIDQFQTCWRRPWDVVCLLGFGLTGTTVLCKNWEYLTQNLPIAYFSWTVFTKYVFFLTHHDRPTLHSTKSCNRSFHRGARYVARSVHHWNVARVRMCNSLPHLPRRHCEQGAALWGSRSCLHSLSNSPSQPADSRAFWLISCLC